MSPSHQTATSGAPAAPGDTAASGGPAARGNDGPAAASSIQELTDALRRHGYLCDRSLATTVYLSLQLERPLLLEGEAGVGKTELAKVLAEVLGTRLIRLQCYEGLDVTTAVYEWDYARQMVEIRLLEARGGAGETSARDIFGPAFLIRRPLLQALESHEGAPPVLLIDEIDRADEEFEAYLLEILSDFQVTVPEVGTIRAERPPRVVITSNRTREVHDALKRRCFYHWIDYPSPEREYEIVRARVPAVPERLAHSVVAFVRALRAADLTKVPGVAETLDWAAALLALGAVELEPDVIDDTLGILLKYEEDVSAVRGARAQALLAANDDADRPDPARPGSAEPGAAHSEARPAAARPVEAPAPRPAA